MNQEQVMSLVRQIALFGGGIAVGRGLITGEQLAAITGVATAVVAAYFAFRSRTDKNLVAAAATKVPVSDTAQKSVGIVEPIKPTK